MKQLNVMARLNKVEAASGKLKDFLKLVAIAQKKLSLTEALVNKVFTVANQKKYPCYVRSSSFNDQVLSVSIAIELPEGTSSSQASAFLKKLGKVEVDYDESDAIANVEINSAIDLEY